MEKSRTTRLRYVRSKDPDRIIQWLNSIGTRVQIYGGPTWDGKAWWLWFVPGELSQDIKPIDLDSI